jgi:hypothetical protein
MGHWHFLLREFAVGQVMVCSMGVIMGEDKAKSTTKAAKSWG